VARPLCSELTARGRPCRKHAVEGSDKCQFHLGRAGRKTLLTPELAEQLVAILRAGNYVEVACTAVGISRRTFAEWMRRGRTFKPEDEPYRRFRERAERARAEGEVRNVAQIANAATTSWQAAAWMLERQYPDRWARVSQREKEEPTSPADLTDEDPFREVDELAERRRRHP
jgi:hypothetical protein